MIKHNNKALLRNDTASKMVRELFAKGYSVSKLAKSLGLNTTTVKAICNGSIRPTHDLKEIQIRLIDVFCQAK